MSLSSLTPSDQVNAAFDSLRKKASEDGKDDLDKSDLTEQEIVQLRQRFSQSVCELEKFWAHKILDHPNHQIALEQFPQWDNYVKVMQREWNAVRKHFDNSLAENVLFIGGGPVPLSAIILAQKYNISSVVLDNDAEAIDLARQMVVALNLQQQIKLVHASGQNFNKYQDFSFIHVAALAGIVPSDKIQIFDAIKSQSKPGTYILTRSSHGSRTVLYLPLDHAIQEQFETVMEIHPNDEVMNSIILLKTGRY